MQIVPLSTLVDFKQAQLPKSADTFVRGVLACGGRVVAETDDVEPQGKIGEFTRANCVMDEAGVYGPGWTTWHECPCGQLMTGVRLYRHEDKWFTGMSAICKTPQRSLPPRKPVKDAVGF